jgi:ASC-1-like (ASCH) protein
MEHRLKTIQPYFNEVVDGKKNFEIRKNDRDYQVGDTLLLEEYSTDTSDWGYTGVIHRKTISYVLKDCQQFGLLNGYCVLGLHNYITN